MDPHTDQQKEYESHDPNPKPDSKPDTHATNGDEKHSKPVSESDPVQNPNSNKSEAEEQQQQQQQQTVTRKSVSWSPELVSESPAPQYYSSRDDGSNNPYVNHEPANPSNFDIKEKMASVKDVLGRWGKKVGEVTKKAEDLAENTWQHLKTGPNFVDAAMGRIAQGTKALAEGGYEKIFRQTFETVPEEQLLNSYACYLSTSAGPVMGTLYVSTAKLAYCSDSPLSYKTEGKTEWSYYKVVIPLHQLKAVNPSSSRVNPSEKYIQLISVDSHEFWFMGFLNYDGAVQTLQDALQQQNS